MNSIEEQVHLPDPQTQYLVHPLDLPEARKEYLAGWWSGIFATPQAFTALLAVLWSVSNNYATPVLVPLVLVVVAGWISSRLTRGAWDYIPRKRHDKNRRMPGMTIGAALIKSVALLIGLIMFMMWGAGQDFVPGFSGYPLGMGAAIVVIMAVQLVIALIPRRTGDQRRTAELVPDVISLVVVAVAVWIGFTILPAGQDGALMDLLPGAGVLLGVWLAWLLYTRWETRRNHG